VDASNKLSFTNRGEAAMKRKNRADREMYERQANLCKAFANPTRLQLIGMLEESDCWASELQQGLEISKANLSQHLSILKAAGIVQTQRNGKQLHCKLAMPEVRKATALFRSMLKSQMRENRRWA
jgi:ArsR family transcriptional regulator, virulence genes transcriptional regulator